MAGMTITNRSTGRWGMKCSCCQEAPKSGKGRDAERRKIKRRERQAVARELRNY